MYPRDTTYHEAYDRAQMAALEQFRAASTEEKTHEWGFPTVYAIRDGQLLGYVSRRHDDVLVVLGPLVLRKDLPLPTRIITGIRLWQAMERVLERYQVKQYVFSVDARRTQYCDELLRLGLSPLGSSTLEGIPYVWYASRGMRHAQGLLSHEVRQR